MLNFLENKLLDSDVSHFPMLQAIKQAMHSCSSCNRNKINVHVALNVAITKYENDKRFAEHCKTVFGRLPVVLSGIKIG